MFFLSIIYSMPLKLNMVSINVHVFLQRLNLFYWNVQRFMSYDLPPLRQSPKIAECWVFGRNPPVSIIRANTHLCQGFGVQGAPGKR